jgi:hypothetical protein
MLAGRRHPVEVANEGQELGAGQPLEEVRSLGHKGEGGAGQPRLPGDIMPIDPGAASSWAQQPGQDAQGGGFAGAVRPEKAEHFARPNLEGKTAERLDCTVALDEALDGDRHRPEDTRWLVV